MKRFFYTSFSTLKSQDKYTTKIQQLVLNCAKKWALIEIKPCGNTLYNHVFECKKESSGEKAILKFSSEPLEILYEARALSFYNGIGSVRLMEIDVENCALLRSYADEPSLLKSFPKNDNNATLIAANLMKKLHLILNKMIK